MIIQWSEADDCYVVLLPDFVGLVSQPCTDGTTYEEAAKHGQQAIESLIDWFQHEGRSLPQPKLFPDQSFQVA